MQLELVQSAAQGVSALAILKYQKSAFSGEQRAFWKNNKQDGASLTLLCIPFSLLFEDINKPGTKE